MRIDAQHLMALIKGAEFIARADADESSLSVLEGVVQVSNAQGEVTATAGMTARVKAGQAPSLNIERVLRIDPREGLAYALRSVVALTQNHREQALKDAEQARRLSSSSAAGVALAWGALYSSRTASMQKTRFLENFYIFLPNIWSLFYRQRLNMAP